MKPDKKKATSLLTGLLCVGLAIGSVALYIVTTAHNAGNALMYTTPHTVTVAAVSTACAILIFAIIRRPLWYSEDTGSANAADEEDETNFDADSSYAAGTVDKASEAESDSCDSGYMDEYPELFEKERPEQDMGLAEEKEYRAFDVRAAMKSSLLNTTEKSAVSGIADGDSEEPVKPTEKADGVPETNIADASEDPQAAWERFISNETDNSDGIPMHLYEDLPDTLPEGFSDPHQSSDDSDSYEDSPETAGSDEEDFYIPTFGERFMAIGTGIMSKVTVTAAAAFLSISLAVMLSFSYVEYSRDGVVVNSPGKALSYGWDSFENILVYPGFFNGELCEKATAFDGTKVDLAPGSYRVGNDFEKSFDGLYYYTAYADTKIRESGAHREIKNREALVSQYSDSTGNLPTQIEKLLS